METARYLVLSTAHIRCATGKALTRWATDEPPSHPLLVAATHHGWFLGTHHMPPGTADELPEELRAILDLGRELGCDYVLLDSDGPIEENLPTFPW